MPHFIKTTGLLTGEQGGFAYHNHDGEMPVDTQKKTGWVAAEAHRYAQRIANRENVEISESADDFGAPCDKFPKTYSPEGKRSRLERVG